MDQSASFNPHSNRSNFPTLSPEPKRSSYWPILLFIFVFIIFIFSGLYLLYIPNQIKGSDGSIFENNQTIFSEKITYLFRTPRAGDVVTFHSTQDDEYIGVGVIIKSESVVDSTYYTIINKKNSITHWTVSRDKIVSHVYFPVYNLPDDPTDLLPSSTPTPTTVPTSTPTLIPTLAPPTAIPTRRPTKAPSPIPTLNVQNTGVPTQTNNNNSPRCEIVSRAVNEGVPQTYNLVYSASYLGGDNYVTGIQWDYNGDGNWDSDLSLNNGNVNYTYSNPGIYTIRMKIQLKSGVTTECSTQVGVQSH